MEQLVVFILVLITHQCLTYQANPFYYQEKEYDENYNVQEADDNAINVVDYLQQIGNLSEAEVYKKSNIKPEKRQMKTCREYKSEESLGEGYYPNLVVHKDCEELKKGEHPPASSRICKHIHCNPKEEKFYYVKNENCQHENIRRKMGCQCSTPQYTVKRL